MKDNCVNDGKQGLPRVGITKCDLDPIREHTHFQGCYHIVPPNSTGPGNVTGKPRVQAEYYSISQFPNQLTSPAIERKKCLGCGVDDLKPEYVYCPICGNLFKE